MANTEQALKLALEALEPMRNPRDDTAVQRAIVAVKEAFTAASAEAQPSQEPVECGCCGGTGRMARDPDIGTDQECFACDGNGTYLEAPQAAHPQPSAPVAQRWNALTDEDRQQVFNSMPGGLDGFLKTWGWLPFAKAIEAKCREKNSTAPQVEAKEGWLSYVDFECTEDQDKQLSIVSGFMAGKAYNEMCHMIGGRFPDCRIEEEAPTAHRFFMELFGAAAPSSQKEGEQKNG